MTYLVLKLEINEMSWVRGITKNNEEREEMEEIVCFGVELNEID